MDPRLERELEEWEKRFNEPKTESWFWPVLWISIVIGGLILIFYIDM